MNVFAKASESHLHGRCQEVQSAIADAVALEDVAERHFSHAEHCTACGPFLDQYRAFALVTVRARRAQDRARDLSPQSWVRIRQSVDQARSERRIRGIALLGLAAASAVAAVLLILPKLTGIDTIQARALAEGTMRAQHHLDIAAPDLKPAVRAQKLGSGEFVVANGQILDGGPLGATYIAYDRHRISVEPSAKVKVKSWERDRMDFQVQEGAATFEANRDTNSETFEVSAAGVDVTVMGTVFTVERTANGTVRVSVDHGRVLTSREGDADEFLQVGEQIIYPPAMDGVGAKPTIKTLRAPPRRQTVTDLDLTFAHPTKTTSVDVSRATSLILATVRAGYCTRALVMIGDLQRSLGSNLPREAVWLTAYCLRRADLMTESAALFKVYGKEGPWQVPEGTELPRLP